MKRHFAGDLFRMYQKHCTEKGWDWSLVNANEGTAGGFKEVVARVEGDGVYGWLKFESGVHRVQRVPDTESQGRVHTSAATVAVLPVAEAVDVDLNVSDIRARHVSSKRSRRSAREQNGVCCAIDSRAIRHCR